MPREQYSFVTSLRDLKVDKPLEVWPESYWPGFLLSQADVFQSYAALWYTKYVSRTPYDIDNRCSKNDGLWRIGVSGQISRCQLENRRRIEDFHF